MAGGARPDPFRTRKLSRRAPMVLRGQPVGEQGAADRWTALGPFRAGRGGAAGDHLRGAPFFHLSAIKHPSCIYSFPFLAYRKTGRLYKGPPGPFFMPASCLACRSSRTGLVPPWSCGSPALRPIRSAWPPAVLSGPDPFLQLSGPVPSGGPLARFSSHGGRGMRL